MVMVMMMMMMMKREKALDILHTECRESVGFCLIGYQSNIECLDLSSLRDFGNTRLCYDREFMKRELLMMSLRKEIFLSLMVCTKSRGW
jgi:hypothetical protein